MAEVFAPLSGRRSGQPLFCPDLWPADWPGKHLHEPEALVDVRVRGTTSVVGAELDRRWHFDPGCVAVRDWVSIFAEQGSFSPILAPILPDLASDDYATLVNFRLPQN